MSGDVERREAGRMFAERLKSPGDGAPGCAGRDER